MRPPSPRSLLGAREFFRDPARYAARHGDSPLVRFAAPRDRYVLVRDPAAIWRLLVADGAQVAPGKWKHRARRFLGSTLNTLHGDEHRARRALLAPGLSRAHVGRFVPSAARRTLAMQETWSPGGSLVLRDALDPLSLTIAADVLLEADLEADAVELSRALRGVMNGVPRWTPPVFGTAARRHLDIVDRLVARAMRDAVAGPSSVLARLRGADLAAPVVRGEVIALLLAAVDEPPSALEATWYLLGTHPAALARLEAEIDRELPDGRAVTVDDLQRLVFLQAVLRETMRLFPPARHIDRCPIADLEIAGQTVRAGTNVLVSPVVTHREPHLHARAAEFVPERWLDEPRGGASKGSYLPFGAGVHACIGEALARMVIAVVLATVTQRWRMHVPPGSPLPVPAAAPLTVVLESR